MANKKPALEFSCMFSGEPTSNEEHVIPRWMQSRYNLWGQTVAIPNGTTLPYRYVKVPVRRIDNTAFGKIESNISRGIFNLQEVYLWALKIHIGFIFRDGSLLVDRRSPLLGNILNVVDYATEIEMFRMLYELWKDSKSISPSPFGSVFVVDAIKHESEFDLIHCNASGTVVLQLGDKLIYVSLWDQGDGMTSNMRDMIEIYHRPYVAGLPEKERNSAAIAAQRVWACECSYGLWRRRRPFNFVKSPSGLILIPPSAIAPGRPAEEKELSVFCRTFGLRLRHFNGEVSNVYELVSDPKAP